MGSRYAQKILFFFCRKCGEYHEKTHPHYAFGVFSSDRVCQMPVELIIDQWNPNKRRYRTETFCYSPISCPLYESGSARKVPGRHGMTYTEEDWVDVEATSHRRLDE
jgi:hypothetical protein